MEKLNKNTVGASCVIMQHTCQIDLPCNYGFALKCNAAQWANQNPNQPFPNPIPKFYLKAKTNPNQNPDPITLTHEPLFIYSFQLLNTRNTHSEVSKKDGSRDTGKC